jgi:hypothetical protein
MILVSVRNSDKDDVKDSVKDDVKDSVKDDVKDSVKGSFKNSVKGNVKICHANEQCSSLTDDLQAQCHKC